MKVSGMLGADLDMAPLAIAELEQRGYNAAFSAEINSDPFFPLVLAAEHSNAIALTTSISVAFARNPMTMANLAWDLNQYSKGRFTAGLGSQIKPHITRRFSMPWSKPAARMREFILAMQAIWDCWETGKKLEFNGEFYQHNLMTPMFTPSRTTYGAPGVNLAAVGPLMTEAAAEVANGVIAHGFTTLQYLQQVTLPAVQRGLEKSGRTREEFDISLPVMVVTGATKEAFEASKAAVKGQLGFYASTPAYKPVLEVHGWGDLQTEANQLTREGRWQEMGALITDDILNAFALVSENIEQVPALLNERYGGLVDTWMCTVETGDREQQQRLVADVQKL
ncbi:MAG: TIGR03617 family F420-dependent LLM class oxidoreductase [Halioglobus sp.]|nr:TIGR03617 family F420-dependent LLM class oxidoreductase [Halioglobus sp.]